MIEDDDEYPWGSGRRSSDTAPITLDALYEGLKYSGPYGPRPVEFETHGYLLIDEDPGVLVPDVIKIHIFITAIRVIMQPDFEYPEWEFEGWVKDDLPVRTWLRGVLKVILPNNHDELDCTLYRLVPGEEWGDSPTQGFE